MSHYRKLTFFSKFCIFFSYAFFYIPMIFVVVYSFNVSRIASIWQGFSTQWYDALIHDSMMMHAGWLSLQIAVYSSCISIVIGAMAGLVLARFGRFWGHGVFSSMITAPLVMPEVITALAMMLFFISVQKMVHDVESILGWRAPNWLRERGMTQIVIAHATFSASWVAVVISSRLREIDVAIEEAAQDLGATPFKVYMSITFPIIFPAIMSGWVMAFSMSLDDVVISAFISGPGTTPLPVVVYSEMKLGVSPKINALATLIIGVVGSATLIYGYILHNLEKKRNREAQIAISRINNLD